MGAGTAGAVVILIVLPLLALLAQSVVPGLFAVPPQLRVALHAGWSALQQPYILRSVIDSTVLAGATAVVGTAIGSAVAYVLEMTDAPARGLFSALVWLVFLAPSFLLAQGWELLLAPGGLMANALGGLPGRLFVSPFGVGLVLALKLFPFATFAVQAGMRGLGRSYAAAARMAGAGQWVTWRRILWPMLLPALLGSAAIIFAEVLGDFGVASTLAQTAGFPLLTYSIYASLTTFPVDFPGAAAQSLLLIAVVAVAYIAQAALSGRRSFATLQSASAAPLRQPLRRLRGWVAAATLALFAVALALPALATVGTSLLPNPAAGLRLDALSAANYVSLAGLSDGLAAVARSTVLSLMAAAAGTLLGVLTTLATRRSRSRLSGFVQVVVTATIAIPGIVLGAGYIFFWNQPWLAHLGLLLYGTPAALLLGYVAGGLPYAVRVGGGAMAQVPESLISAARLCGAGLGTTVRRVVLPLLQDTWSTVGVMLFAGAFFELPVSQLLYPPGQPTVAVGIVHQMTNENYGIGAAATVVATAALGLAVLLLRSALARLHPRPQGTRGARKEGVGTAPGQSREVGAATIGAND